MNYFYILISKKENLEALQDTITLIKKFCLKDSNKYSVNINKMMHSNCTLDSSSDNFLSVYNSKDNNYEEFELYYLEKYKCSKTDIEILLKVYNTINIESIEQKKVQVKVNYSLSFINALQFVIELLGQEDALNNIFLNSNGETINQIINNNTESDLAIVENNHIYQAFYDMGSIKKDTKIIKNEVFIKYLQYKRLNKKFKTNNIKEIRKI